MAKRINIIGQTFNNWRVDAYVGESKYRCTCLLCNRQFDVNSFSLRSGSSKNCTMCSINTRKKKYTVNSYSKLQISCIRDIENLLRENNIEYNTESDNTTNSYDFILYDYNIVISFILSNSCSSFSVPKPKSAKAFSLHSGHSSFLKIV